MLKKAEISDKKAMILLAQEIAESISNTSIIGLTGTLGAGKSFFAKQFINHLQEKSSEILSPTFNLVLSYKTPKATIFHFDLYRLKDKSELENIGFFESIKSGICLIEWPQIAQNFLKKLPNYIEINIEIKEGEKRIVEISSKNAG